MDVESDDDVAPVPAPAGPVATDAEFAALLGRPIPEPRGLSPFHQDTVVSDLDATVVGRVVAKGMEQVLARAMAVDSDDPSYPMVHAMMGQMPARGVAMNSNGRVSLDAMDRVIATLNRARRR